MSEERFDRIDRKLTDLGAKVESGLGAVNRRVDDLDTRMESGFDTVNRRIDDLDTRMESGFDAVNRRVDDLDRHMHVLHEDVIGRIAAIPDNTARLEGRMDRGFADLKETIGRRLDPLEAAVRQHSVEIERLKRDRPA